MGKYQDLTKDIPWKSFGRETVVAGVGRSLVPVGLLPYEPLKMSPAEAPKIFMNDPAAEKYLMNIVGTAIQAGDGKLVTCGHVVDALAARQEKAYILARIVRDGTVFLIPYPIVKALKYLDPRTDAINPYVDLSALIVPAKSTQDVPYETPNVRWGDSTQVGVGDQVVIGGYPLGESMFLLAKSNRSIVQPTFYAGVVSAVLPATQPHETRMFQVSIPSFGGMSGGAMIDPTTGDVIGMVTSCLHIKEFPQPMSYVIPSEVIAPYVEVITFKTT